MYGESDFRYLCLIVGYCWYCVNAARVPDYKVDVVVVRVICVRDSVIGLCVYACGKVEADGYVDELFDVEVFYDGSDVEIFACGFL